MKKSFVRILAAFTLTLSFCVNFQSNSLVENSAFADGSCCPEIGSFCPNANGGPPIPNTYLSSQNSCSSNSIKSLSLAL